jgi:transposase
MINALQNSQENSKNTELENKIKKDENSKTHQHLSTIFVIVGIISFTLGAVVNYYTIKRITGGKA